jgi:hypothetical protein
MRRVVRAVAIMAIALALTTTFAGPAGAAPRRVTIYGDSLTVQATPYLEQMAPRFRVDLTVRAAPGTAPCDYVPVLRDDLESSPPDVVVLAFSGNSFITCMRDASGNPLTGDALLAKYRDDVEAAVADATRAHRPIVLASPPVATGREIEWRLLDAFYRELAAARPRVHYLDAGAGIAPHGHFALEQRCLRAETKMAETASICRSTRSRIAVRSPDGLHFCGELNQPAPLRCPEYASGAQRYATNLLRGATEVQAPRRHRS